MSQKNKIAIRRRQALHDGLDLRSPFGPFVVLFGGRTRAFYLYLITAVGVLGFEALSSYRISPHVVDGGVVGYSIKPGREFIFGTVFSKRIVNFNKNFLRDVQRGFIVTQHAKDITGDRPLIPPNEFLETIDTTPNGDRDQLAIGESRNYIDDCS